MKTLSPNDFGNKFLVEDCQKVKIKDLLKKCRERFKEVLMNAELEAMGIEIKLATSKTHYNGTRFWFKCPKCGRRVGVLYEHPLNNDIGCRTCLDLDYKKRRYKGMLEENIGS